MSQGTHQNAAAGGVKALCAPPEPGTCRNKAELAMLVNSPLICRTQNWENTQMHPGTHVMSKLLWHTVLGRTTLGRTNARHTHQCQAHTPMPGTHTNARHTPIPGTRQAHTNARHTHHQCQAHTPMPGTHLMNAICFRSSVRVSCTTTAGGQRGEPVGWACWRGARGAPGNGSSQHPLACTCTQVAPHTGPNAGAKYWR